MSYFRSYFSKNNTIIKDLEVNTSKNPDTEIFYGCGFAKYIFKIDLDPLKSKINNGDLVLNGETKHYLNLTNTVFGDETLLSTLNGRGRERATSFDLILFVIDEYWDEGVGFFYKKEFGYNELDKTYGIEPSNWCYRTTLEEWSEAGIYSGSPQTILATIHFDNGNENINVDITDHINDILTGNTINFGLGLAFAPEYQTLRTDFEQSVAFFAKYTQTFFEPYLESTFNDVIIDNRNDFAIGVNTNNLYLYVTKNDMYYDLDYLPTVDILDNRNNVIEGLSGLTPTKVRKGIYKVTFGIDGELCKSKQFFYDRWCDISVDGVLLDCITQRFTPKPITDIFSIGGYKTEYNRFAIQFTGIKLNEQIKRGSLRKVIVTFRSIDQSHPPVLDSVYYRIYVKEGKTQVIVFDWTRCDKTLENSFYIDTSYMIPREYWVEIKGYVNGQEIIYYKDEIKFEIISER